MMKKRWLTLAALLCAGTVCASVGAAKLADETKVVSAATTTSTWTDNKGTDDTSDDVTYTFEGNVNENHTNITTTDIGDLGNSLYQMPLATEEGLSGAAVTHDTSKSSHANVYLMDDQAWTGETSGVHFRFKTEGAWYTPAGTFGGTASAANYTARVYVTFGTTYFWFEPHSSGNSELKINLRSRGTDTKYADWKTIAWGYFKENAQTGKFDMNDTWSEVKIARYKCTAIGGDASAAKGYWLKIYVTKPGEAFSGAVTAFNGYIPDAMSDANNDYFSIRNSTMGYAADPAYVITEAGYENYQSRLYLRRGDGAVKATVDQEVYKDAAEYTAENKILAESYAMGHKPEIIESGFIGYRNHEEFINVTPDSAFGIEFRTKHVDGGEKVKGYKDSSGMSQHFMTWNIGGVGMYVSLNTKTNRLMYDIFSNIDSAKGAGRPTKYTGLYNTPMSMAYTYDTTAEYAWRLTRSPVKYTSGTAMSGWGAIIRIYMGKVDATTGMPATGWDSKPLVEFYDANPRTDTDTKRTGLSIQSTYVGADGEYKLHEMIFSSNKYAGVKTIIDEEVSITPVVRGQSYTLNAIEQENLVHLGWTKGADRYSASDFVTSAYTAQNIINPVTFKALAFKLESDKKASLRFRQRLVSGVLQPLELSLNWKVLADDIGDAAYYFGGVNFGYKLTSSNDHSYEAEVTKISNGMNEPYQYSVTQSNIGVEDYTMKFVFQAYVEVNGVKYYTAKPDMDTYGRSVDFVADAAAADLRQAPTVENGVEFKNVIRNADDTIKGYHYLTQEQYNVVYAASVVNS